MRCNRLDRKTNSHGRRRRNILSAAEQTYVNDGTVLRHAIAFRLHPRLCVCKPYRLRCDRLGRTEIGIEGGSATFSILYLSALVQIFDGTVLRYANEFEMHPRFWAVISCSSKCNRPGGKRDRHGGRRPNTVNCRSSTKASVNDGTILRHSIEFRQDAGSWVVSKYKLCCDRLVGRGYAPLLLSTKTDWCWCKHICTVAQSHNVSHSLNSLSACTLSSRSTSVAIDRCSSMVRRGGGACHLRL